MFNGLPVFTWEVLFSDKWLVSAFGYAQTKLSFGFKAATKSSSNKHWPEPWIVTIFETIACMGYLQPAV